MQSASPGKMPALVAMGLLSRRRGMGDLQGNARLLSGCSVTPECTPIHTRHWRREHVCRTSNRKSNMPTMPASATWY